MPAPTQISTGISTCANIGRMNSISTHTAAPMASDAVSGLTIGLSASHGEMPEEGRPLEIGKGRILREGTKVALLNFGARLGECLKAADALAGFGLSTTLADARFAKPLDTDLVLRLAREHEVLVTIEEGAIGGFGSYVMQTLAENGALDTGLKFRAMVLPDVFIDQDSPAAMYAKAGLDAKGITAKVFEALGKDKAEETVKLA